MKKTKIAHLLGIIVTLSGLTIMVGWILDIDILKSILPVWVTMKFTTALSFFLSGIILYFLASSEAGSAEIAKIVLPLMTLFIFLIMVTLLVSTFVGIRTGVEDLFVKETEGAVKSVTPGRPSVGTMINFICIAIAGIFTMLDLTKLKPNVQIIGWIVFVVGGVAVIGYIINVPLLYYTLERYSTAMALHTAILFMLLGVGLILLGRQE